MLGFWVVNTHLPASPACLASSAAAAIAASGSPARSSGFSTTSR